MEHFIAPQGAEIIEVPYVGTEDYDGGDFMTYPSRKGWSEDDLMGLDSFGGRLEAHEEVEAFFQTWLYFGCLISVFELVGIKLKTGDFIRVTEREDRVISTSKLPGIIQDWMNREGMTDKSYKELATAHIPELVDKSAKLKRGQMIETTLLRVLFFVNMYCSHEAQERAKNFGTEPSFWPVSPKIAMSIMAIGVPLLHVATGVYGYPAYKKPRWGSSSYLNERLAKVGWCIREIPMFGEMASVDCDYYFGSYPSPRKQLDHKKCTKVVCCAKNVDVESYRTKHVTVVCNCRPMRSALKKIRAIVKKGGIPIISWRGRKLVAVEYDKKSNNKYVAISHVWSDGMGNAKHNSLPECQLTRIQGFVDQLYAENHDLPKPRGKLNISLDERVGFWMDTLCVPVGKKYTEYRQAAIRKMKDIYQSADRVLVLDSFAQEVPRSAHIAEKCSRLYLSNWHRRLWTLQEGLLGKALFFQFRDGAQTMTDMYPELHADQKSLTSFYSSVRANCMGSFDPFYDMVDFSTSIVSKFHTFAYSMRSRSTTRGDDEPICFASTLGLDPNPLFPYKGEKRMEKFYELVGRFSPKILFNEFPRLQADGFRWAPRSFLGQSYNPFPVPSRLGVRVRVPDATLDSGGGLRVTFAGAKLQVGAVEAHFGTTLYLVPRELQSCWYGIRLRPDTEGNYPLWNPESTYMILSFQPIQDVPLSSKGATSEAILGTFVSAESDGCIRIRYEGRAIVELLDQRGLSRLKKRSTHYLDGKNSFSKDEQDYDGRYPVIVDWLDKQQRWCVL